jgi:type II secretory pathway pseudopilin PulG
MAIDAIHSRAGFTMIRPSGGRRPGGFTMMETLLAIMLSSLVGLVVASMLGAVGSGTQAQNDIRRASVKRQVAIARLGAALRGGTMVLGGNGEHLVLWKGDVRDNDLPNLSELLRVEWDPETKELWMYQAPPTLTDGQDTPYALSTNFSNVTASLAGSAQFPGRVLLQGVSDWNLELDQDVFQQARLIRLHLTLEQPSGPEPAVIVVALRAASE